MTRSNSESKSEAHKSPERPRTPLNGTTATHVVRDVDREPASVLELLSFLVRTAHSDSSELRCMNRRLGTIARILQHTNEIMCETAGMWHYVPQSDDDYDTDDE